jgi:hypothetical protein
LKLWDCIPVLFLVVLAVGGTSSIRAVPPPIRGLAFADLRDMFEEIHNGHRHEAIDIIEPRGTPYVIFELGPERLWWKGNAVNPYPGLINALIVHVKF